MKQTFDTVADLAEFIAFYPEEYSFDVVDLSQFDFNFGLNDFAEQIFQYGTITKYCYVAGHLKFVRLLTPFGTLQICGVGRIEKFFGIVLNSVDRWGNLDVGAKGQFFLTNTYYLENWIEKTMNSPSLMNVTVESLL